MQVLDSMNMMEHAHRIIGDPTPIHPSDRADCQDQLALTTPEC
jgi:hypothetical protein